MKSDLIKFMFAVISALLLAACASSQPAVVMEAADLAGAINHTDRRVGDSANDERRKAEETLAFFGVAPGMIVFEIEAGGGYFTELMSRVVGPNGEVVMQNPESFLAFFGEELTARLADNRLSNVRQSLSLFDAFDAEDASIDLVTWVQGPHELYYMPEDGVSLGDPAASYAEIFRITKPGGSFVVIDHSAIAGSPETSGNELHRIDKAIVINMAEAAGFVVDGEGDFLAKPEDDRTLLVFAPEIRGKTNQFAVRFSKPK